MLLNEIKTKKKQKLLYYCFLTEALFNGKVSGKQLPNLYAETKKQKSKNKTIKNPTEHYNCDRNLSLTQIV